MFINSNIRNFRVTYLLINIMLIIMLVLIYAFFLCFLSIDCNVILATIKKKNED